MVKPRNLLIRRVLVWSTWSLVLLTGLAAIFVWSSRRAFDAAMADFERRVGPVEHARYVREPVPPEQNRAVAVQAALEGVDVEGDWMRAPEPSAWTAEQAQQARAAFDGLSVSFASLEAALALPDCVWPAVASENVGGWSDAALKAIRLLKLAGFIGVLDREAGLIERSFAGLGSLGDCLGDQPALIGSIVAMAVRRARLEIVRAAVASPGTEEALLDAFREGLEQTIEREPVAWAVAAEGAFALRFIERPDLAEGIVRRGPLYSIFARRVATEFARRWVEFRLWSAQPLDRLLSDAPVDIESKPRPAGVIADLLIPNLRDAVIRMRLLERFNALAVTAIDCRLAGRRQGSFESFLAAHPELATIPQAGGSLVLHDRELESILRDRYLDPNGEASPGVEALIQLTVWRLPPPGE